MIEIVEWALAAFRSNPGASEEQLRQLLSDAGMPAGLATHAVTLLPHAFGRRILARVKNFPDEAIAAGRTLKLSKDPLFAAAVARAARASREDVECVGLRSAEVNAANSLLKSGGRLEDLRFTPAVFLFAPSLEPDPAWAANELRTLTEGHGSRLRWEARVFANELIAGRAQLQLDVVVPGGRGRRDIVESFAGLGATIGEATAEALSKFARGSLHVLLAVLEQKGLGGNQVEWEDWGPWRVCVGPLLRQWSDEVEFDRLRYAQYLDALKEKLLAEPLTAELHWYRSFVGIRDTLIGHDALLDNEPWPPGSELLTQWGWPPSEKAYALRHFFALMPRTTSWWKPSSWLRRPTA